MAEADRERWNRRYPERYAERSYDFMPTRWLPEIADELRAAFETLGLETLHYDEVGPRGTARLLARRP